ncbi:hypothetical protein OUY22_09480 [Nonomuraea sp. MCN248]|uniref:LapA family protein n=1 Tax=Nonomuraea corallina TaxID=2989783 RepID=A0ABT4S9B3_9ACTN|nr:hypothetical protein [Nonomuraea corallina]MDA0633648.1 hypothetical protein [Nonomuraea corallina]
MILGVGGAILVFAEEGTRYDVFGYVFEPNHVEMFVAGAAAAAVLLLGLWLIALGSRRSARRRRALRGVRADASQRVAELENEKRRLQERLEKEQAAKEQAEKEQAAKEDPAKDRVVTDRVARHAADDRATTTTAPAMTADDRLVARGTEESRR